MLGARLSGSFFNMSERRTCVFSWSTCLKSGWKYSNFSGRDKADPVNIKVISLRHIEEQPLPHVTVTEVAIDNRRNVIGTDINAMAAGSLNNIVKLSREVGH